LLQREINGHPLAYLDNAATTQKPQPVLDALDRYYRRHNANPHRGVHTLSMEATEQYERARTGVASLLNAADRREIVFTRGTTEAINLVAQAFARPSLTEGDEILVTHLEHHSNIVPWQILCRQTGARLRVAPINDRGEVIQERYEGLLSDRTRIVALSHVSNALGTINPVRSMIAAARRRGIPVIVDGAQAVPHLPIDVQHLDCDFYAFSGHKLYAPTGVGVLYARHELLEQMPPYQGGGEMINAVSFEGTTYAPPPAKFEAGTPNIAGAIGLGAAIDYVRGIGLETIAAHEHDLLTYATERLREIDALRLIGTSEDKAAVISFVIEGIHPHDLGTVLDTRAVAIRTGHHCAQPTMERFGVPATARASFALYNTRKEADRLVEALRYAVEVLG